jgi:hypothetical protein
MKNLFIVALDKNTKIQNDKFNEYIDENGFGWWYWIDGFWILNDTNGTLTTEVLHNKLADIYPNIHKMVIELGNKNLDWKGYGPNGGPDGDKKNMFEWLHENL